MAETDPDSNEEQLKLPADFRLKPSRNQKQRSKLQQVVEEPTQPPSERTPAPAAPPPPAAPLLRRNRLKRSGHMHEDLKPPPEEPKPRESEY